MSFIDVVAMISMTDLLFFTAYNATMTGKCCIASFATLFNLQQKPQRWFGYLDYAAHTWPHSRRMIIKAEPNAQGANPRFVVASLTQCARYIYATLYCTRGNMENHIKEQFQLFPYCTSCHEGWPNQFRLLCRHGVCVD